jgi:hypothetical protein
MSNYLSLPNSSTLQQFDQLNNQFSPDSFQNYLPLGGGPSPDTIQLGLQSLSSGNNNTNSMEHMNHPSLAGVDGGYLGSRSTNNNNLGNILPSLSTMGTAASNRMLQGVNIDTRGQDNFLERQQQLLYDIH